MSAQNLTPSAPTALYEFVRFILTGVTATIGNMSVVYGLGYLIEYRLALIAGLIVGFVISFAMGKLFAFKSSSVSSTPREFGRFILVYTIGATLYWFAASFVGLHVATRFFSPRLAEIVGVLTGASLMVITSYFGHRWFTFAHANSR